MTRVFYQLWDELLSEMIKQAEEMKVSAFHAISCMCFIYNKLCIQVFSPCDFDSVYEPLIGKLNSNNHTCIADNN